jgi:hypothetical protein
MAMCPVEIRRCQHIKTRGAQCGSPALRKEAFCYYHSQSRPERIKIKGEGGQKAEILVPVFEDANSIQMTVRQVAILLLQDKIDSKKAGLVLYALQIASSNLKRMDEEKPRPAQVVVDVKKVGETPVGMTPWSFHERGREPEQLPDARVARTKREILEDEENELRREEQEWMSLQLEGMDRFMTKQALNLEDWISAKPEPSTGRMKGVLQLVKESLEEVTLANRKHILLSDLVYPSKERDAMMGLTPE